MSKKDYTKFSKSQHDDHKTANVDSIPEVTYPFPEDDIPVELVTEPENVDQKPIVFGKVVDCSKLNIRQYPNLFANVLGCLDKDTEIEIDEDKSSNDFYAICTPTGLEGFCLKKFVEICK